MALYSNRELQQYGHLELLARQAVEGFITGLHKSPFHGFSVEFAEHRLYNPGESIKHVDWKLFGRTDKLFVKRFEEETNLRCQIIIDNSSSMFFPFDKSKNLIAQSKINYAVFCAAVFVYLLKLQRDAFGITVFSDKIETHTPARSNSQHHHFIMGELNKLIQTDVLNTNKHTSIANNLHEISERINKRSLVVLLSDMFDANNNSDELLSALQHMRHNKHEVIVFHINDKSKEMDFNYENRPYKFVDLENEKSIILNPSEIRKQYAQHLKEHFQLIKSQCTANRIDFLEIDINAEPAAVLKPFFTKRKKLL